jgi:hypothetical protein
MLATDVLASLVLKFLNAEFDELIIEIFTAEMRVTTGGLDLDYSSVHG